MTQQKATHITWHEGDLKQEDRRRVLAQAGATIWMTGLSASGKSTIACLLEKELVGMGLHAYRLDGDNIRHGLNKNLGFTAEDRAENIRRIGEVAKLFTDSCVFAITAFISPYRADRDQARKLHEAAGLPFIEVFVECPIEVAEARDPKGLYKKARAGQLKGFTGIDDPYEAPQNPELVLRTDKSTVQECSAAIMGYLRSKGLLPA